MSNETAVVKLHECRVSRRGKAAKGTVVISTFGIPIKPKTGEVIKKWDYDSLVKKLSWRECVDAVEQLSGLNQHLMKVAFLSGADNVKRSTAIKAGSELSLLVDRVMQQGLAITRKDAIITVKAWQANRASALKSFMQVYTYEEYFAALEKNVNSLKAQGLWAGKLVTESTDSETADISEDAMLQELIAAEDDEDEDSEESE